MNMNEKDQYQVHSLQIETLSPLHIGSGIQINGRGEYYATTARVIFPNYEALMKAIKKAGKLGEYVDYILQSGVDTNTFDTLKDWDISLSAADFERELHLNSNKDISGQNDILHLHAKIGDNPLGKDKVYVAGSSLKGAIRNTLIFRHLIENKSLLNEIENDLSRALTEKKPIRAIEDCWQKYENKKQKSGQYDPEIYKIISTKFANAIRVSDSEEVLDTDLVVEQVYRRSFSETTTTGVDYLLECIDTDKTIATQISIYLPNIEKEVFKTIKWTKLNDLFKTINEFSAKNLAFEKKQIEDSKLDAAIKKSIVNQIAELQKSISESKNEYAIIRLGKGKTKFFQTILLALNDNLRNNILRLFRKDDQATLPQSRVLTHDNQMLGWVKIMPQKTKMSQNIKIITNKIDNIQKDKTTLTAYYLDERLAEIHINDSILTVPMSNKFREILEVYSQIQVLVTDISKQNEIIRVRLISE